MRGIVIVLACVLGACASDGATPSCSGANVSFQHDVVPIVGHCGGEECHGGISGFSWPYSELVGPASTECSDGRMLVAPGDPANSYLVKKLEGVDMCQGSRMPRFGDPLPAAKIQTITDWICEGAPDN